MNINWEEYDKKVNIEELRSLANKSKEKEFKKVNYGTYSVSIHSLLLTKSKAGARMIKAAFKIVNGENEGKTIYMYQLVDKRFQVDLCNSFLRSLDSVVDVHFAGYDDYEDIIKRIWVDVKDSKIYRLYYSCNNSGYDTFKILEVSDSSF